MPGELAAAWALARRFRVDHVVREIDPLSLPEFRHNRRQRCYACKQAIITRAWEIAAARGHSVLWDGTNLDDLADFRPGLAHSGNRESKARCWRRTWARRPFAP